MACRVVLLAFFVTATCSSWALGILYPRMMPFYPPMLGLWDRLEMPALDVEDKRVEHMQNLCQDAEARLRQLQTAQHKNSAEESAKLQDTINLCLQLHANPSAVLEKTHDAYLETLPKDGDAANKEKQHWEELTKAYQDQLAQILKGYGL